MQPTHFEQVALDKSYRLMNHGPTVLVSAQHAGVTNVMARLTYAVGSDSARDVPDKLARHRVRTFAAPGSELPLVEGCVGWLACRLMPEPHNQNQYDLFIGEVIGAWADNRVFRKGHWHFDDAPDALRTIHHVAGGQFLVTGEVVQG
jgi:flavin reductase (DIM6/NTAB) family NADH-FMN oxidoreductase RutF